MKMCCTCTFLELLQLQTVCNFYNYTYNGVIKALGMGAAVTTGTVVIATLHAKHKILHACLLHFSISSCT